MTFSGREVESITSDELDANQVNTFVSSVGSSRPFVRWKDQCWIVTHFITEDHADGQPRLVFELHAVDIRHCGGPTEAVSQK